ncbi:MAG: hypothetical protein ACXWCW_30400 [Burkholderiales bacterium]
MKAILRHYETIRQIMQLPVAHLRFESQLEPTDVPEQYRYFTKPHPRYRIIRNKTIGAALIDLDRYQGVPDYFDHIQGKNRGAHHAKRARGRGYVCREIDRNAHVDEIHSINTSLDIRQGRPMDDNYLEKVTHYEPLAHYHYYGVLNQEGRLVAYANIGRFGNFSSLDRLMGLRNNDGIMHLLLVEIASRLIEQKRVRYMMYDTFFGAQPGLQQFKRCLGFEPYRAKYSLQ